MIAIPSFICLYKETGIYPVLYISQKKDVFCLDLPIAPNNTVVSKMCRFLRLLQRLLSVRFNLELGTHYVGCARRNYSLLNPK